MRQSDSTWTSVKERDDHAGASRTAPTRRPHDASMLADIGLFSARYIKRIASCTTIRFLSTRPLLPDGPTQRLPSFGDHRFQLAGGWNPRESMDDIEKGDIDQTDDPQKSAPPDGAACRQHHLRNGAARRISAALRPLAPLRRLGPGGGRSVASFTPIYPNCPRAISRRQATAIAPGSRAGSGSSSGIEGGMSTGTRFLPATQASTMSDHSCIMWRR